MDEVRIYGNVEVKQSATEGLGLFAREPIAANAVIRKRLILRELTVENPLQQSERSDHVTSIDDRLFLVGEPDCYLNHSCDPNCYLLYNELVPELVARRDISAEEQITLDYLINNGGGDSWQCSCGVSRCRGKTGTSYFDLPSAFQKEYFPLLADWFLDRYADKLVHHV